MSEQKTGVLKAIAAVMATLAKEGIGKNNRNVQQGYQFRGIDDVYNALASALVNAGLVIVPAFRDRQVVERLSAKGAALFYVTLEATFTLHCVEDGSSLSCGPFFGEAMDSGDKATNKAMSAAYKYMAMEVFCIPTQGDNDADATTHEVAARSPWTDELKDLAKESSAKGTKAYQEFWRSLSEAARSVLVQTPEHAAFKDSARKADEPIKEAA